MDTATHTLAGLIAYLVESRDERNYLLLLFYLIAANLPDIDHIRVLKSIGLGFLYQPRIVFHNVFVVGAMCIVFLYVSTKMFRKILPLLAIQPLVHVILDLVNIGAVMFFYPVYNKWYSISNYLANSLTGTEVIGFIVTREAVYSMIGAFTALLYATTCIIFRGFQIREFAPNNDKKVKNDLLNKVEEYVKRVYEENWGKYPPSHDFLHVKRVLRLAEVIGREEGLNSEEMVALRLAVYLHDIAIALTGQKKGHAEKSARIAEEILKEYGVSGETIRCVCEAIREHSWNLNRKPSSRVSAVLQDADRLDALGMIGFARLYTYGSYLNRRFYHEEEPTPVTRRPLENVYTLDHVYTKLIHIPERMNTRTGKIIAEKRLNRLKKAVEDMIKEISGKD